MALSLDQITAITRKYFLPKLADNVFLGNPALRRIKEKCSMSVTGGTSIVLPLEYAESNGDWYSGAETLDTSDVETFTGAELQWKQLYAPVTISRIDELKNMGDEQVIDFVKAKVKNAEKTLAKKLSVGIYSDGSDSDSIVGLRDWVAADQTVGGISQVDNSWWQAQVNSSTTTLTLAAMQTLMSDCSEDKDEPSVIYCTKSIYNSYYALLQPQQRFVDEESAKAGFTSLMFNGIPVLRDSNCPSSHLFMINEEYLKLCYHPKENMRMDDFERPRNQNVKSAMIFWAGAFGSNNNRFHGKFSALTA